MADLRATCEALVLQGQPGLRLALPGGDALVVLTHGAQVVSWMAGGRERLFLSPQAVLDGRSPVRGGVPVCFPQFNQRGPDPLGRLPKHGHARTRPWRAGTPQLAPQEACLDWQLASDADTLALGTGPFALTLSLRLRPGQLTLTLTVHNPGPSPLAFTGALHTYLAVEDVVDAAVQGLAGRPQWDAVHDHADTAPDALRFAGEFDRVYDLADGAPVLRLLEAGRPVLAIDQAGAWGQAVVWNPGPALGARLADLPADAWRRFLCVEAARVDPPVVLAAGGTWQAWQDLQVMDPMSA